MGKGFFGTDGVRGRVGSDPMTVDFAVRLASAAAQVFVPKGGTVLIGKDTRLSGYMFESALEAGFTPYATPDLARREVVDGLAFSPRGPETQIYSVEGTDLDLIGTAEITLGGLYADRVLSEEDHLRGRARRVDDGARPRGRLCAGARHGVHRARSGPRIRGADCSSSTVRAPTRSMMLLTVVITR